MFVERRPGRQLAELLRHRPRRLGRQPGLVLPVMILLAIWQFGAPMVIFLAGLKQIPKELYEAAEVDGAGPCHSSARSRCRCCRR